MSEATSGQKPADDADKPSEAEAKPTEAKAEEPETSGSPAETTSEPSESAVTAAETASEPSEPSVTAVETTSEPSETSDAVVETASERSEPSDAVVETASERSETSDAVVETKPEPEAPPAVESIEPAHGPLSGGTAIVITGTGFAEGCEVYIGGVLATAERASDTRLAVTTPEGAARGDAEVVVKNPDGQSDTRAAAFHFDAPPALTGVEPSAVSVKGGAVVTLLGSDFAEGCSALIDGASVPVARAHQGRLEAVASPHAVGAVDVSVKNPDGQRTTLAGALRYVEPPVVTGVDPSRSVTTGGAEVTIAGQHFEEGCAVLFAGAPVAEVKFVSATELRVSAPSHDKTESVDVAVVNPTGIAHRLPLAFAYERAAPKIAQVSPAFGPNSGGTKLTVTGTDLDAKCAVFVCGIASRVTWKSRQEIVVETPQVARDGLVDIRVVNIDDQAATAEKAFRYDAPLLPCVLTALSPGKGSQVGGTKVTLVGDDFAEGVKVRFAGTLAESKFVTRKQIEAVAPAYAGSGDVPVEVENPDGVTSTLEKAFTYEARPAPSITSVSPPNGPTTGGTKIVIEGTNFTKDCQVYVGREFPRDQVVKSATEIHVVVIPRKTAGVVDVEVAAPGVPKAVAKNAYRYDAVPAPVLTSVSPNAGGVGGGTEMSVMGKNFRKDTIVLMDGKQPKTIKFIDTQTLEFKAPPGESGKMVDVIVRNPDGKEAVQKRAFMYDPRYR